MTLPAILKKAIPVYAGDSFSVPLILRDEVTQEPSDLSAWGDWTAWVALRGTKLAEFTVTRVGANEIHLDLNPAETRALFEKVGRNTKLDFDVQGKSGDIVSTWVRGQLSITDDITKED